MKSRSSLPCSFLRIPLSLQLQKKVERRPHSAVRNRLGSVVWALAVWWFGVAVMALLMVLTSHTAKAEIGLSGALSVELQNDRTYRSSDRDAHINDLYFTIEPSLSLEFFGVYGFNG